MVRNAQLSVDLKVDTSNLWRSLLEAVALARTLPNGGQRCPSHWPGDPAGPDYVGTQCWLDDTHLVHAPTIGHKALVSDTVVTWP